MSLMRYLILCLFCSLLIACDNATPTNNKSKSPNPHLVEVIEASHTTVSITRVRTGSLTALKEIAIYNQEEGQITDFPFYEGDRVEKGQVVAKLDDRLLQAQLARADAELKKAQKDLLRIKGLTERGLMPETEITRVETEVAVAQADKQVLLTRIDYTTLRAPVSGIISHRFSEAGNIAEQYSHLLTISDQSQLLMEVSVSELMINQLHLGEDVSIQIDALNNQGGISGQVTRIFPTIDPITRTGLIEITIPSVPEGAKPGQFARVTLRTQPVSRLLIPFSTLRQNKVGSFVFVVNQDNLAQVKHVKTGLRVDDQIEITEGLAQGDLVITRGFTNLIEGKSVSIVSAFSPNNSLPDTL
jgi:membrane fusion protein (multidrug efflux system)